MQEHSFSITVDGDICMGAGYCYGSYPQLFTENPDGTSLAADTTSIESLDDAVKASQICPSGAIEIHRRKD
ncbi:ferredoxin [Mycobacteroides franklinii]|uniref:Ferredoxin n=1 Tax=Mycobacteroides franklinii TaxID=948102 RepID=A0A4R5P571_9MYCO|nr:ferredoxin [Mycobacteroides franklinii]ORA57641.1 ferredoxin [Mycobacteroides franklinii]TDH18108.1 ferredoxin [Mycobacteroides franklinii]